MNDKNYEYLTEQLKRTGFGDTLNEELRNNIEKQNAEFTLNVQKTYGTDAVSATLQFKKSEQFDMFFFNSYEIKLKKEEQDNDIKQTFYTDKGITLKEAYNMLDGRAVNKMLINKESEKYKACCSWILKIIRRQAIIQSSNTIRIMDLIWKKPCQNIRLRNCKMKSLKNLLLNL